MLTLEKELELVERFGGHNVVDVKDFPSEQASIILEPPNKFALVIRYLLSILRSDTPERFSVRKIRATEVT